MYRWFVARVVRSVFAANSRSDWSVALGKFADDVHFRFPGSHELGADIHSKADMVGWFEHLKGLFPALHFDVQQVVVRGWPWNTTACTRYVVRYTLPDGEEVANPGMQYLRIVWGKVKADHLYLDSQIVASSIDRVIKARSRSAADAGVVGAAR
jgi:ketosteroid isomerase-like protein